MKITLSKLIERAVYGIITVALAYWVGFHILSQYYNPIETETVYEYTKNQVIPARGIAIRDELVIEQRSYGIENYLFEDGERVSVGQTVAEFYESVGSDYSIKRMREIEAEIIMLTLAHDKNINNFANTETLNRDIRDQLGRLTILSETGRLSGAGDVRGNLTSLLNRRQVATGKVDGYHNRIEALKSELASLERGTSGTAMVAAAAPVTGYFVKSVDGYENYLSPASVAGYGIAEYLRLIRTAIAQPADEYAGKMVTSHNWYFAAALPSEYAADKVKGRSVRLEFTSAGVTLPATIHDVIFGKDNPNGIVVFHCDVVTSEAMNLRVEDVTIHIVEHTGMRISTSSLRFVDDVRGVYVIEDNNIVRFKEVKPIYEETGFVLTAKNVLEAPEYRPREVRLYNRVITKGTDLYDGKALG